MKLFSAIAVLKCLIRLLQSSVGKFYEVESLPFGKVAPFKSNARCRLSAIQLLSLIDEDYIVNSSRFKRLQQKDTWFDQPPL